MIENEVLSLLKSDSCRIEESVVFKTQAGTYWHVVIIDESGEPISGGFGLEKQHARMRKAAWPSGEAACPTALNWAEEPLR